LNEARNKEASVFFIGNGGSAATASHFANDIAIGTNDYVLPYKAVSLTDNNAIITAIGNDHGYDQIFIRQLKIFGKPNDVLVGISASGNSENIINAFNYATEIEMDTIAITAFDGGKMKDISKNNIHIPTEINEYGPAEDVHMILDHLVSNYLMRFVKSD
jgi:D-sedoheptulose 7-phosphate isomerase